MPSALLVKANRTGAGKGQDTREIVAVTPAQAGWEYVGFRALRLSVGEVETFLVDDAKQARECCLLVLCGHVDVMVEGVGEKQSDEKSIHVFNNLGTRASVFEDLAPAALYLATGHRVTITAVAPGLDNMVEVALCFAPTDKVARAVSQIDSGQMRSSTRGKGSNTRYIRDVLPHTDSRAAHLLVVEVRTPASHSSSYPPHKHDRELEGKETQLEETYYHRLHPAQGYALQRVYTDDRTLDEACAAENHDVVMVPRGYHPVTVPYGYESYYLNVMAGPQRLWVFQNDPQHEWMLK